MPLLPVIRSPVVVRARRDLTFPIGGVPKPSRDMPSRDRLSRDHLHDFPGVPGTRGVPGVPGVLALGNVPGVPALDNVSSGVPRLLLAVATDCTVDDREGGCSI